MKIFIISIFILLTFSPFNNLYSQYTSWENISNQLPGDSLNNLSDAFVLNRWVGWISSISNSEIYRSVFSSGIWEVLQTPSPITAFHMLDYSYGFACGTDSAVYKTTDDGENWIYFGSLGKSINDIDLTKDFQVLGYICGDNGAVGSITDTGLVNLNSGLNTDLSSLSSPLKDRVWLLGDSSIYFYDGSIFAKQLTSTVLLNSIYFLNELYGWVVGDSGYITLSTDGGNTWTQKQNPDTLRRNLHGIHMLGNYGWVVGDDGLILRTTDAGDTWVIDTDWLTPNMLISVHIGGSSSGFGPGLAVGENKTALIYPIVVSIDDEVITIDDFELFQNYPNPFNPTTTIKYQIPELSFVTLKVFDVLGNEVATLINEEKPAGEYVVEFGGDGLTSGIYFYQLHAGDYTNTKKMILLR